MKTKEEIVKSITELNYLGDDRPVSICHSEIHECMDEYAEEYAKAGIRHTLDVLGKAGYSIGPLSEAEAFFLQSFKESLKK